MQYTDVLTLVGARCQPLIRCNFYTKGFIKSFAVTPPHSRCASRHEAVLGPWDAQARHVNSCGIRINQTKPKGTERAFAYWVPICRYVNLDGHTTRQQRCVPRRTIRAWYDKGKMQANKAERRRVAACMDQEGKLELSRAHNAMHYSGSRLATREVGR